MTTKRKQFRFVQLFSLFVLFPNFLPVVLHCFNKTVLSSASHSSRSSEVKKLLQVALQPCWKLGPVSFRTTSVGTLMSVLRVSSFLFKETC